VAHAEAQLAAHLGDLVDADLLRDVVVIDVAAFRSGLRQADRAMAAAFPAVELAAADSI
jgi:hypothetical protein